MSHNGTNWCQKDLQVGLALTEGGLLVVNGLRRLAWWQLRLPVSVRVLRAQVPQPREVFRAAIVANAAAVVPQPSERGSGTKPGGPGYVGTFTGWPARGCRAGAR